MNTNLRMTIPVVALCLFSASATGLGVVREFQGSASITTPEFEARAPWIIDWRVNGEYSQALGFEITLIDARTGLHLGQALKTKQRGNGVRLFDTSGRYRLRIISSLANWRIKVEELSREDAKLYTPR